MKDSEIIDTLKRLEAHYDLALRNVRELLTIESRDCNLDGVTFERLTKAKAASIVMRENGGKMLRPELLKEMPKRGHPIAGENAISTMLSRDGRFVRGQGVGMWSLVE